MKKGTGPKIVGFVMVGIGVSDLIMGTTQTPLPVLGEYLNQQWDALLIAGGIALMLMF